MTERVTRAVLARIAASLGERDVAILADVGSVRVLTGRQIERLHFAGLAGAHRDRTRRRVLERLVSLQLLATLPRRIGGVRAGSAGLVFVLGLAGQRLRSLALVDETATGRVRQPGAATDRFLSHNLAVAELYVSLVEATRTGVLTLDAFRAEPACWWQDSDGQWVKPDAYAVVSHGDIEDSWAIEVDLATESLPTLRRKLVAYLDLVRHGEKGPEGGMLPRVFITVPDSRRLRDVQGLIAALPSPARTLFAVTVHELAVARLGEVLRE